MILYRSTCSAGRKSQKLIGVSFDRFHFSTKPWVAKFHIQTDCFPSHLPFALLHSVQLSSKMPLARCHSCRKARSFRRRISRVWKAKRELKRVLNLTNFLHQLYSMHNLQSEHRAKAEFLTLPRHDISNSLTNIGGMVCHSL